MPLTLHFLAKCLAWFLLLTVPYHEGCGFSLFVNVYVVSNVYVVTVSFCCLVNRFPTSIYISLAIPRSYPFLQLGSSAVGNVYSQALQCNINSVGVLNMITLFNQIQTRIFKLYVGIADACIQNCRGVSLASRLSKRYRTLFVCSGSSWLSYNDHEKHQNK